MHCLKWRARIMAACELALITLEGGDRRKRPACLYDKSRPRAHNPNKWGP